MDLLHEVSVGHSGRRVHPVDDGIYKPNPLGREMGWRKGWESSAERQGVATMKIS